MQGIKRLVQQWAARLSDLLDEHKRRNAYFDLKSRGLLEVGRHSYGVPLIRTQKGSERKIIIGNFCSISKGVVILTGGIHPLDWVSTYPFRIKWRLPGAYTDGMPTSRGEIVVGSDVWFGTNSVVLSGVTIGHGAVIAAGAVVADDVPPYAIVGGVPARIIRYRFGPDIVEQLLGIRWWDWDDDTIREAIPLLSSNNIEAFVERYRSTL